jgi:hypothetical protein
MRPSFASQRGQEIFLFSVTSRPDPGPTQPAIQRAMGDLFQGEKPTVRKVIHLSHSSADRKNQRR